jgi:signal transduction histidine kinase
VTEPAGQPGRTSWLRPRTLSTQLLLLLLAALVAAQILAAWVLTDERRSAIDVARREQIVDQLGPIVRLLLISGPDERERITEAFRGAPLRLSVDPDSAVAAQEKFRVGRLRDRLERAIGTPMREVRIDLDGWTDSDDWQGRHGRPPYLLLVSIGLPDGAWLNARLAVKPPTVAIAISHITILAISALAIALVVLLSARRITWPLRQLAEAAERVGRGERVPPLPETGPREIRAATSTFNRMQERLQRFVGDRMRMLAAIGHDLRTPITTLRLRAELLDESETRARMLETLEDMQHMVEATLAFARDEAEVEPARPVDLNALVESIADDLADIGQPVSFTPGPAVPLMGRPSALRRAIRNLVDNAVRYGGKAEIGIAPGGEEAEVVVEDDGPGLPEDRIEAMFEPFVRMDPSRSTATGGVGLGLAIARSVARHHGGEVTLSNRPTGGLKASLRLPLGRFAAARR